MEWFISPGQLWVNISSEESVSVAVTDYGQWSKRYHFRRVVTLEMHVGKAFRMK